MVRPQGNWRRVSDQNRCPICNKPDWCLTTGPDGNPTAVICARTESPWPAGNKGAGWMHQLQPHNRAPTRTWTVNLRTTVSAAGTIVDWNALAELYATAVDPQPLV